MSGINWGDVPTWFGTTFAALAAGAAVWTLKSQRDQIGEQRAFIGEQSATLALERAELRAAAEDRKWAQARKVYSEHRLRQHGTEGAALREVVVVNNSDASIHVIDVRFGTAYLAAEVHEMVPGTLPRDYQLGERWMAPRHLLGPGRGVIFRSQAGPESTAHNNPPTVSFTDDSGQRWTLDPHGKLDEAPPDPQA